MVSPASQDLNNAYTEMLTRLAQAKVYMQMRYRI